ncbi:tRNA uridine(34) 5-carboxymethylaminomethyl modification radical SAM/GNAT enzyme Elp3 [Candidatus Dojkabacteria bacterium]|nr:tRNA uridine(34) 5-carboxymethylaminomethyl modification radical SAM/GNAT enzyme Elp3 [Candidatus Dojkabacteria bacterium]
MNTKYNFDYSKYKKELSCILTEISQTEKLNWRKFRQILSKYPKDGNKIFSKNNLVIGLQKLRAENYPNLPSEDDLMEKIQMKPVRTQSGVTTVTALTKPYPCPGKCIFCPNDVRMPKSYLSDEPGAQRAGKNNFDPYLQVYRRLNALKNIGHGVSKVEIIILGGTWSYYPENYQIWFVKRCFEALNDFGEGIDNLIETEKDIEKLNYAEKDLDASNIRNESYNKMVSKISRNSNLKLINAKQAATWDELFFEQKRNETSNCRNVGLVIETRPDNISPGEVIRIRKLGCTKTQIGIQSLNDNVLALNNRGHDVAATIKAFELLRQAGFKIHGHWMGNLYGSTLKKDIQDYKKLFEGNNFHPDELKIYPCMLVETAELMEYYQKGLWKPFDSEEMLELLNATITATPEYCRLTRVIREFSSKDIVDGVKNSNFRQLSEDDLDKSGIIRKDIRSREIKDTNITYDDLKLNIIDYETSVSNEKFIQYVTNENKIAGFLRLSLPKLKKHPYITELDNASIIREIHVYGKSIKVGVKSKGNAQHLGLGTKLIEIAKGITIKEKYDKIAVISAIGTREYYRKRGFVDGELYQSVSI